MQTTLPFFSGTHAEIGNALGQQFRAAARSLTTSAAWREVQAGYDSNQIQEWMARVREIFPDYLEELQGMACGMDIKADALFRWNCLPDTIPHNASRSCTIAINRLGFRFVIHAQQYGPAAHQQPALVEIRPHHKPAIICTLVPGRLAGLGAAANHAGLLQIATCVTSGMPDDGLPSAFVARAVLGADSLASALDIVMQCKQAGQDRHILASTLEFIMAAVEGRAAERLLMPIPNKILFRSDAMTAYESGFDGLHELYKELQHYPDTDDVVQLWNKYRLAVSKPHVQALFFSVSKNYIDLYSHPGSTLQSRLRFTTASCQ